jgi:hypothetical protein
VNGLGLKAVAFFWGEVYYVLRQGLISTATMYFTIVNIYIIVFYLAIYPVFRYIVLKTNHSKMYSTTYVLKLKEIEERYSIYCGVDF